MTSPRTTRRACAALLALGAVATIAACTASPSSDDADAGPSASSSPSIDPQDAMLAYAQCLRDHGVDAPDPVDGRMRIDGRGMTEEQMQAAQDACAAWQRLAEPQEDVRELSEEDKQRFLDQAQCMRDKGWDVPDPTFDGGRVTQELHRTPGATHAPGEPNLDDPQFQADQEACAEDAGLEPPAGGSEEES
ncbi:hypothetical protein [Cellulomonas palmilytica]|uniref:hypothetical protein n=1 Tax=Cellulomonas palmilytica TaxID=2608402 RepID=UPI001F44AF2E|nr:hypothetical protein [Cellulomonas palmilytica]UJP40186.1 hypothetical protein F1D97_01130 [Cellulomonas palmilytica]